ncbi:MAG TPA: sulfatase [Vicinamibacteria bacterium]|nr:sulfatase [Vicinamibacteria bacterium]
MTHSRLAAFGLALAAGACGGGREPEAPVDLLGLTYVVFSPTEEEELRSPIDFSGDIRPALVAPTPAEFRYRVTVPAEGFLTFAMGIAQAPHARGDEPLPGARMRFRVRAGDKVVDDVLFDREIHVGRRGRWIDQSVDLGRHGGREIWLSLETSFPGYEAVEGAPPLPLVGVFADPALHDRGRHPRSRGVVIVSIDTLRRDHTSLYGYPRRTTPGLEALSSDALVFEDAVSTSSWTLPAHASLLTSTVPSVHGASDLHVGLSPEWPNLAQLLRDNGFFTQAIVTHLYLSRHYGFGTGFDRHRYLPETRAEEVTDQAIRFLHAWADRDFFLFVHYYDPHWHYDPPAPYDDVFDPRYEGEATGIWWDFKELTAEEIEPSDLHHIQALYDGEILYTDRHVERLFQEMKRLGVFEESIIVVTSDHGEEFLEHGGWEHQKTLYEEQLRIPLVVKLPLSLGHPNGRVEAQVSLIDVAPTVAQVLGVEVPETFQGRSLLDGDEPVEAWSETEHTLDGSHLIAMRRGASGDKVIYTLKGNEVGVRVFDLLADPEERNGEEGDSGRLSQALDAYLTAATARRAGKSASPKVELTPEEVERLRALGYIP